MCFSKVNSAYIFQTQLINVIDISDQDHEVGQPRFKRMANSPINPKLLVETDDDSVSSKRTQVRRSLHLELQDDSSIDIPPTSEDYCYSSVQSLEKTKKILFTLNHRRL
jgi:hypothetical protein